MKLAEGMDAALAVLKSGLLLTLLFLARTSQAALVEPLDRMLEAARNSANRGHVVDVMLQGREARSSDPAQPALIHTGIVSPGHSPACVNNSASVTFNVTSVLKVELLGTTPCTQYDRFSVGGTLTLQGGALLVSFVDLTHGGPAFLPPAGAQFQILTWGTLVGSFGSVTLPTLPAGMVWNTSSLYTTGTIAIDSAPPVVQPVPIAAGVPVVLGTLLAWAGVPHQRALEFISRRL